MRRGVFRDLHTGTPSHVGLLGGGLFGCLLGMTIAMRESPPGWIENYQVGARGEQRTAKAVEPLLKQGWVVLHDLTRISANLDHVLIGPAGIFILDTKNNPGGTAEAKGDLLRLVRPDGNVSFESDKLARQIRGQAVALHDRLLQRCGIRAWVDGIVVLWADFSAGAGRGNKMSYIHGDQLVSWLEKQPARLSATEIRAIAAALEPGQRRRPRHPVIAPAAS
jgi:hypothetical protein